jgi:serine/threonine-protein kinase
VAEASFAEGLLGIVLDGRYRLDALLGEGGMGAVYRAHHLAMDRKVAVKLLKPHLTQDANALQRFAREARATLKVDSPHAVKVLDFGVTPHDDYYMVLEYLDGRTVQRELDVDGPFAPARVLHIAKQAARALGAAHRSGLIHRDIKPDNLLLMREGGDPDFTKVLDFGVAKLMEGAATSDRSAMAITAAGMVFGTPEFMSPEQACGHPLDGRSDLYALAATMFAMLTGCGLYQAGSAIEWLTCHARQPPPHLVDGKPDLVAYPLLDELIQCCLAKRPEQRPADADAMIRMIEEVERGRPISQPGAVATAPARAKLVPTPSSYIEVPQALRDDPAATLPPPQRNVTDSVPAVPSRRGLWLALGAVVVLAMVIAAIAIASRKKQKDAAVVAKPTDAGSAIVTVADAAVDAAVVAVGIDAGAIDAPVVVHNQTHVSHTNPEVERLLAGAFAAQRQGKHLTQIQDADAVLRLDPNNVRAKLLIADGLIASGDLATGCKHLRELGRNPVAVQRAKSANCPSN